MTTNKNVLVFKDRLEEAMKGDSISSFAKKCNMSETVIRDYLSGKTYPSLNRLAIIAEKCNLSYNWLATGHTLEEVTSSSNIEVYNEKIFRIPVYSKQMPTIEESKTQRYVRGTPPVMNYPVLEGWLAYRGLQPDQVIIYWAKGDMMAPEIKNNNGVIVDTNVRDVIDGAIYLIEYEDITLLRRIRLTIDGWLLQANSSDSETIVVPRKESSKYKVVGHVVQIIRDLY